MHNVMYTKQYGVSGHVADQWLHSLLYYVPRVCLYRNRFLMCVAMLAQYMSSCVCPSVCHVCLQVSISKIIAHQTWGSDQSTLLTLYRTLIRSKRDCGAIVYGSAWKSYLKILGS